MIRYIVYLNNKPYISDSKLSEANCEAYMIADLGLVEVKDNMNNNKVIWTNKKEDKQ